MAVTIRYPFKSQENFLDLVINDTYTREQILSNLTKEKYYIAKFLHTSYLDLDEITPIERRMLLKFLNQDMEAENAKIEQASKSISG